LDSRRFAGIGVVSQSDGESARFASRAGAAGCYRNEFVDHVVTLE
jgi:hypothetical protein